MTRLDLLLVERGEFTSREKARRTIMAGRVKVDGRLVDKPGAAVAPGARLEVAAPAEPFVSRGGRKLAHALDHFGVDPAGAVCVDVGASTGGFTHCLLERGARRVYAIDVGYGQLDYALRRDPRVVVMERVNARALTPGDLPEECDLATVDVSFISLTKVLPAVTSLVRRGGRLIALVKPQFEVGKGQVGKGGVVRDEVLRREVIERRIVDFEAAGLSCHGWIDSPIRGARGNLEALVLLERP
ncbi:MAG: TlyA family RNA methyltransferase [Acidobacteriota bacterium]|nr:TlyA family RNA methyltransferase [Acidobacteriota bacterium]MDH3522457.1 TlyA family RNA methyltransferase [Acidobacteriota bacterium]